MWPEYSETEDSLMCHWPQSKHDSWGKTESKVEDIRRNLQRQDRKDHLISWPHPEGHVGGWASPSGKTMSLRDMVAWWAILLRCGMFNFPSVQLSTVCWGPQAWCQWHVLVLCELCLHQVFTIVCGKKRHRLFLPPLTPPSLLFLLFCCTPFKDC